MGILNENFSVGLLPDLPETAASAGGESSTRAETRSKSGSTEKPKLEETGDLVREAKEMGTPKSAAAVTPPRSITAVAITPPLPGYDAATMVSTPPPSRPEVAVITVTPPPSCCDVAVNTPPKVPASLDTSFVDLQVRRASKLNFDDSDATSLGSNMDLTLLSQKQGE